MMCTSTQASAPTSTYVMECDIPAVQPAMYAVAIMAAMLVAIFFSKVIE